MTLVQGLVLLGMILALAFVMYMVGRSHGWMAAIDKEARPQLEKRRQAEEKCRKLEEALATIRAWTEPEDAGCANSNVVHAVYLHGKKLRVEALE